MRLTLALLCLLAVRGWTEDASHEPDPPPRAPVAGQSFDDREIIRYLEVEGRKLMAAKPLPVLKMAATRCDLALEKPSVAKVPLAEASARAESATVVLGEFYREGKKRQVQFASAAGGFFITATGALLTSLHVITEKDSLGFVAMTRDGRVFAVASALAADPVQDLVVLQLDVPAGVNLPALSLDAEAVPSGSPIAVMSHPDQHFWMLTTGTVARHTVWRAGHGDEYFTCITADFAAGSSGCPVLDECGNVAAIVNNTESLYYDDDGKKKQVDLQMVVKNTTPAWVARHLFTPPRASASQDGSAR
jgi:S1-C subfamily serine protease